MRRAQSPQLPPSPPPATSDGRHPRPRENQRLPQNPAQRRGGVFQGGRAALRPEPHHQAADRGQVQDRGGPSARYRPGHVSAASLLGAAPRPSLPRCFIFRGLIFFPGRLTARGFRDFSRAARLLWRPRFHGSGQLFPVFCLAGWGEEPPLGVASFPLPPHLLPELFQTQLSYSPSFSAVCPGGKGERPLRPRMLRMHRAYSKAETGTGEDPQTGNCLWVQGQP